MKKIAAAAILFIALGAGGLTTGALAQEPFIGEIRDFGMNFCPRGWAKTDGQLLEISENTALYSLLGIKFGGDARMTFGLPSMRPPFDANNVPLSRCIALVGVYPSRN